MTYRMPATGEAWRHYKGNLYTVVGVATDAVTGGPFVLYTAFGGRGRESIGQKIFIRPIEDFLRVIEIDEQSAGNASLAHVVHTPRFAFEREVGCDPGCPFINPGRAGTETP